MASLANPPGRRTDNRSGHLGPGGTSVGFASKQFERQMSYQFICVPTLVCTMAKQDLKSQQDTGRKEMVGYRILELIQQELGSFTLTKTTFSIGRDGCQCFRPSVEGELMVV